MTPQFIVTISLASLCCLAGCSENRKTPQREELAQPLDVFGNATEEICLSDGSSVFIFHPNGDFELAPLGESGRAVRGKWKLSAGMVEVTGLWSWANGISADDDFRTMIINVGSIDPKSIKFIAKTMGRDFKVRDAYFVIESVEKQKR